MWPDGGKPLADSIQRDDRGIGIERVLARVDNPPPTLLALFEDFVLLLVRWIVRAIEMKVTRHGGSIRVSVSGEKGCNPRDREKGTG